MRRFVFPLALLLLTACTRTGAISGPIQTSDVTFQAAQATEPKAPPPLTPEYPGKTIDEVFPVLESHDFQEEQFKDRKYVVTVANHQVEISRFIPTFLKRNSRRLLKFQVASGEYWASLVGESHLLGPESKQIYVVASGPGGVCCTNYWIVDIASEEPRIIFRSQDFGSFRNPMEIADDDRDGNYELVQFDSCMRYFGDDCGSCSPEPRAYFAYDKKLKQYRPAKGIRQAFVKAGFSDSEQWLEAKHKEFQSTGDISVQYDLRRSLLAHIADLLHVGDESKGWDYYRKFRNIVDDKDKAEMKKRLAQCKFYKSLHARQ